MSEVNMESHTLSAYVANKPGVLSRIAQVFARRSYNIDSLVVSPASNGRFSRMTMTVNGDPAGLEQTIKQLNKLVDIVHCFDHTDESAVARELALIKVGVTAAKRTEVLQVAEHFGAKTVDLTENSLTLSVTGNSDKLDAIINLLRKYEIIELVRTGKVVMARGDKTT